MIWSPALNRWLRRGYNLDIKDVKKISKLVISDLEKNGGRCKLRSVVRSEQPECSLCQISQATITDHSAGSAQEKKRAGWRKHICGVLHVVGISTVSSGPSWLPSYGKFLTGTRSDFYTEPHRDSVLALAMLLKRPEPVLFFSLEALQFFLTQKM